MPTIIIDVELTPADAAAKAKALGDQIKQIKQAQIDLRKANQETGTEFVKNAAQLKTLSQEQKAYVNLSKDAAGSNNQLRAQLALLTNQYNALSKTERDNTTAGKALAKQTKEISDELKKNEAAVGDNRRSVGGYLEAINKATFDMIPFGSEVGRTGHALEALGGIVVEATEGISLLSLSLLAIPVAAVGAVLAGLAVYFTSTQEGADKMSLAINRTKVAFQESMGAIQEWGKSLDHDFWGTLGKNLTDFNTQLNKDLLDMGKSLALFAIGLTSLDFKTAGKGLKEFILGSDKLNETSKKGVDIGKQITDQQIQIEKNEIQLIKEKGELNRKFQEQSEIARNILLTENERKAGAASAIEASKELQALNTKDIDAKIKLVKLNQSITKEGVLNRENQKELATLEASREQTIADGIKERRRITSLNNKLEQGDITELAKVQKEADTLHLEYLASLSREAATLLDTYGKELEATDSYYTQLITKQQNFLTENAKLLAKYPDMKKKVDDTIVQLETERNARLKEINEKFRLQDEDRLLKIQQDTEKLVVAGMRDLQAAQVKQIQDDTTVKIAELNKADTATQKIIDQQNAQILSLTGKGKDDEIKILKDSVTREQAILKASGDYRAQFIIDQDKKEADLKQSIATKNAQNRESGDLSIAMRDGDFQVQLKIKQEQLKTQYDQDIYAAQGNADALYAIKEKYTNDVNALNLASFTAEQDLNIQRLAALDSTVSEFGALFKKNTIAQKAAFLVQKALTLSSIILSFEEAKAKAIAANAWIPLFGVAKGIAEATVLGIEEALSVATVIGTTVQGLKDGGFVSDGKGSLVSGAGSSRSDSIPARLSNNESVINANSTQMFKPLLSAINVAGGGRPFDGYSGNGFAMGGIVQGGYVTGLSEIADFANQNNIIIQSLRNAPRPIVDVRQIITESQKYHAVQVNQNI